MTIEQKYTEEQIQSAAQELYRAVGDCFPYRVLKYLAERQPQPMRGGVVSDLELSACERVYDAEIDELNTDRVVGFRHDYSHSDAMRAALENFIAGRDGE